MEQNNRKQRVITANKADRRELLKLLIPITKIAPH